MLTSYQSNKTGIVGQLDELANRMENAGMTEEVARRWAQRVRVIITELEKPNPIVEAMNRIAETNERQTLELEAFKRQLYQQAATDEANRKHRR